MALNAKSSVLSGKIEIVVEEASRFVVSSSVETMSSLLALFVKNYPILINHFEDIQSEKLGRPKRFAIIESEEEVKHVEKLRAEAISLTEQHFVQEQEILKLYTTLPFHAKERVRNQILLIQ